MNNSVYNFSFVKKWVCQPAQSCKGRQAGVLLKINKPCSQKEKIYDDYSPPM